MYPWFSHDIKHGVCSGIPSCCILWFVYVWAPNFTGRKDDKGNRLIFSKKEQAAFRRKWMRRADKSFWKSMGLPNIHYIACPDCIRRGSFIEDTRKCHPSRCECLSFWETRNREDQPTNNNKV